MKIYVQKKQAYSFICLLYLSCIIKYNESLHVFVSTYIFWYFPNEVFLVKTRKVIKQD